MNRKKTKAPKKFRIEAVPVGKDIKVYAQSIETLMNSREQDGYSTQLLDRKKGIVVSGMRRPLRQLFEKPDRGAPEEPGEKKDPGPKPRPGTRERLGRFFNTTPSFDEPAQLKKAV